MVVPRTGSLKRTVVGITSGVLLSLLTASQVMAQAAPIDPYPPAPPAAPPAPPPAAGSSNSGNTSTNNTSGNSAPVLNNNNTSTVSPTITANPTNTNTNDNRSTATNSNTIYIYPPSYAPPAVVAPPIAPPPVYTPPSASLPPLIPAPAYGRPAYPQYPARRIRLSCAQLCGTPPAPLPYFPTSPVRERVRFISFGAHVTALGMAHQPLAGWGTLWGGGIQIQFRSRGRFGFEMSQDFLKGDLKAVTDGPSITRKSYPFEFTFKGYILPNSDKHHFNMYFGGGLGAMASNLSYNNINIDGGSQNFLEWMIHADAGAELRFKWFALGLDGRVHGIVRDRNFGDGAYYGNISDGVVPASTWGLEGRGYMNFWF